MSCLAQDGRPWVNTSAYAVVMTYDPESLSLFDLSEPSLFYFPDLKHKGRCDVFASPDSTVSTSTLRSASEELLGDGGIGQAKPEASLPPGFPTSCPSYWTGETSFLWHESISTSLSCGSWENAFDADAKRTVPDSGTSSPVDSPPAGLEAEPRCDLCGRRCRDSKALL